MSSPDTTPLNSDYAQEWIAFLRRRNTLLSIVWPILLVLAISTGFAAIYFFQSSQTLQTQLENLSDKHQSLASDKNGLQTELEQLTEKNIQLTAEIDVLRTTQEKLSVQQDDSVSKLNITSQMLENLEQQVAIFKAENAELSDQLNLAKEALATMEDSYKEEILKLNSQKTATLNDLNKQLESRKIAYQALANRQQEMRDEMDRMSNLVASKEKELTKLQNDKKALLADLNEKQKLLQMKEADFAALQKNYNELDNKLKALVSPIGASNAKTVAKPESQERGAENPKKPVNVTGFEEIKKPKPAPASSNQNSLDYDQIRVLP